MDLSWPKGFSVNDAIHKCKYLDSYFTLQYPSIDYIIDKVKAIGPGSLLYKVDISRAFRHIRSLLYITKCIKPARFFLNRMLQVLRESLDVPYITLSPQFHLDLKWFNVFLKQYNGVTFFDNKPVDFQVYLDASLSGLGGVFGPLVYVPP